MPPSPPVSYWLRSRVSAEGSVVMLVGLGAGHGLKFAALTDPSLVANWMVRTVEVALSSAAADI